MKVRVLGFEWKITSGATLPQFLEYLRGISGEEFEANVIAVTHLRRPDELWAGVMLTIKDQRAYTEMRRRRKGFQVTPRELEENTNIADVNFFIINRDTGRGLYQYYHHSMALSGFASFSRQQFRKFQSLNDIQTGHLRQSHLVRPESFEDLIESLQIIKSFEFEAITYEPTEGIFRALEGLADRRKHRLVFFQKRHRTTAAVQAIKDAMKALAMAGQLSKARVEGIDEEGIEQVHKLFNEPDTYSEFEYDEFVRTVNLDANNLDQTISRSAVIKRLVRLYAEDRINALLTVPEA